MSTKPTRIGNLESVKRAFCNGDFNEFDKLIKSANPPFVMFMGDGGEENIPMEFIVRNRVAGFVQSLDKNTKWIFACFQAEPVADDSGNRYKFTSCWIVNTTTPIADLGIDTNSWILTEAKTAEVTKYFTQDAVEGMKCLAH